MDEESVRSIATAAGLLFGLGAFGTLPLWLGLSHLPGVDKWNLGVVVVSASGISAVLLRFRSATRSQIERWFPVFVTPTFVVTPLLLVIAVLSIGPRIGTVALYYVEVIFMAFFNLRRRWAVAVSAFALIGYGVALVLLDNPPVPVPQFVNLLSASVATGVLIGGLANRLDATRRELADLNQNLEDRVAEQVHDLEREGRLRRFLSPQVVEVVTSEGAEELLAPHRCEVAVLFVDLRGFTAYTNAVDADQIVRVLDEYYAAVGEILERHGATIGGFDGDGVMAYIGDPIPVDKPVLEMLQVAKQVADRLDGVVDGWAVGAATLGYGIGLAFGPATLGVVGFEGRSDYTPLGAVVNLAARLCADARHGEIVIDDEVRKTAGVRGAARRADVDLKGFGVVATYAVGH
jgi:class 3 adenylate cyclase